MKLSEYDKINDNDEKYAFFREFTYNLDFSNVTLDEIWYLIDISFTLFRYCFENNEFENSEYVSKQCEKMLDYYLCASNWEELCVNDEKIEFILDVVCFVYELSYKYEQKSKILRKVLANPKKYAPSGVYIMRIHGTFVNFLDLSPDVQEDIIKRLDLSSTTYGG